MVPAWYSRDCQCRSMIEETEKKVFSFPMSIAKRLNGTNNWSSFFVLLYMLINPWDLQHYRYFLPRESSPLFKIITENIYVNEDPLYSISFLCAQEVQSQQNSKSCKTGMQFVLRIIIYLIALDTAAHRFRQFLATVKFTFTVDIIPHLILHAIRRTT